MRFAGTWKQYSTKAIPQLTRITIHKGESLYLRCPYQAMVMKMFDTVSRAIVYMDSFPSRALWLVAYGVWLKYPFDPCLSHVL